MSFSFWEQTSFLEGYDVVVAGSGIIGLNTAWNLKKRSPHLNILVIERGAIPSGASTRNAGVACFGTISEIIEDLKSHSREEVFGLVERRLKGLKKLRENLGDENIKYEPFGGYELFFEADEKTFASANEQREQVNKALRSITGSPETYKISDDKINPFGFRGVKHLVENVAEGQIDTGKMMFTLLHKCLQSGIVIMNGTEIMSFDDSGKQVEIRAEKNIRIRAKKLVLATNGFSQKLVPALDVKPARAQVLITSPVEDLPIRGAFHFDTGFYFFRNVGNRVLFGGGRNLDFKAEETTLFGLTEVVQQRLEKILSENILPKKNYTIENRWSGIMGMGSRKAPIISQLSTNVFCAVRMSGMGVAIGSLVGEETAEMVLSHFN